MPISTPAARARGALGAAIQRGDDARAAYARSALRAAVLADRIDQAIRAAPPLTYPQRRALAERLLAPEGMT